jgi:hypothetical protein
MFSIIVLQLLELQIPNFLVRHARGIDIETNLIEHPLSFRIHCVIFGACTLIIDPLTKMWVRAWHIAYDAGREAGRVLEWGIQDDGKAVDSPKQLTMTMFSIIILQLLELHIPIFLFRLVPKREFKTKLVELRFSFSVHSAILEEGTLLAHPLPQSWVKAVAAWHSTWNSGRETGGVLVGYSR